MFKYIIILPLFILLNFLCLQARESQGVNRTSPGRRSDDDEDDEGESDENELENEAELCDHSAIFILAAPIFSPYLKPYSLPSGSNRVRIFSPSGGNMYMFFFCPQLWFGDIFYSL